MKLLFLYLILGFTPIESKVDRLPQSTSSFAVCDSREVAKGIQGGVTVPRAVIFHYGKKELLLKDLAEGNISESDWNDYIMGDQTRFKLKRFRRGFYGTEYAEDADRFGDSTYNWLVEINLKPECLTSERVASLVYLPLHPEFKKWYQLRSYPRTFDQYQSMCFDSDAYPRYGKFMNYKNPNEAADFVENECEKVIAEYYEDQKFAFIHDHAGDLVRSWAVRDRNCIADIQGSDSYWAKAFSTRSEFWVNTCNRDRNHRNNIRVWFSALSNTGISMKTAEQFSKMIHTLTEPSDQTDWATAETDRFAAQDFSDALTSAVKKCGAMGRTPELKEGLGEIAKSVDALQSPEVKMKLERLCR